MGRAAEKTGDSRPLANNGVHGPAGARVGKQCARSGCGGVAGRETEGCIAVEMQSTDMLWELSSAGRMPAVPPDAGRGERGASGSL